MGIIQRQGIKHTIVNFSGLAIGTASTIFIYAQKEVVEAYGLTQYLLSIAVIGFPLFALSGNTVAIRFFPNFQNKDHSNHGFLPLLIGMCLAGWSIWATLAALAWEPLKHAFAYDRPLVHQYLWLAFPLTLLYSLALLLYQYTYNFKRIVVPSILFDFSFKVILPVFMIALLLGWIDLDIALRLLVVHYGLVVLSLALYLRHLGEWSWRPDPAFLTPELRKDITRYAGFGILSGLALLLATKADTLMVGSLTNMKSTGIYVIALNIAAAVEIPSKSLTGVSVSFVARYLADENWVEMKNLYQKVSINLLAAGLLLFGCVWVSADDLYAIMPNTEEVAEGKYVLLFLSMAKLVDMGAGLNNTLVYYSKYYRYSLASLSILALANLGFNITLIPLLGLPGAAIATLLSVSCYNLFNLFLVWKKFHMQPFSWKTAWVIGLAIVSLLALSLVPHSASALLNILFRSGLFALLFTSLVLYLHISPDINQLWGALLARVRWKAKKS